MTTQLAFETVLLDVDGTLVDSNGAHAQAWAQALREAGVAVEIDEVRRVIGMGGDKLLPALANVGEDSPRGQAISRRKKHLFETLVPDLQPTRGARALVEFLRDSGIAVVIATSADDQELESLLKRADVADLIPKRASKDDASQSKPDPDIVEAALARAEATSEEAVLVGDTPFDIEAAHRAGIGCLALRCGGHWSDTALAGALDIFDDPADLLRRWRERRLTAPNSSST